MTIGIVVSRADSASVVIGEELRGVADWEARTDDARPDSEGGGRYHVRDGFELREFDELHLYLEDVADAFDDPDAVVFVSRHAGETGPLLSAHVTGNVGPADHGGRPNELAAAPPNLLSRALTALDRHAPEGYDVGIECTHHGPSRVGAPSMFVELGSTEEQWGDREAAAAVARAVLDLADVEPRRERTVVGIGGGHYAPRFSRIARETDWAVGHVIADWAIEAAGGLEPAVIDQAFERSDATRAVVDGDRPEIRRRVADRGFRVVSETWVRETAGIPLDTVERAEALLCAVDDGLRFGERGKSDPGAPAVDSDLGAVAVNPEILDLAYGVDPRATRRAVASATVAYVTEEGGNRPTGRVAVPEPADVGELVDSLADVIAGGGATVEREGETLVVEDSTFDPERARELGVPEGPAFGRLADGETVEVDGETVEPAAVHRERTRRLPIEPDDA